MCFEGFENDVFKGIEGRIRHYLGFEPSNNVCNGVRLGGEIVRRARRRAVRRMGLSLVVEGAVVVEEGAKLTDEG